MLVLGNIIGAAGLDGLVVEAQDVDFRSRQLLGRQKLGSGSEAYRIEYGQQQFFKSEKRSADVVVKVLDRAGRILAESDILFNAPEEARIDLEIRPLEPERPRTTNEYDDLINDIAPLVGAAEPRTFTEAERHFLAQECLRATSPVPSRDLAELETRLEALWRADIWTQETGINRIAFYGWLRIGVADTLAALLDIPPPRLDEALRRAIEGRIVPDIGREIAGIIADLAGLRIDQGTDRRVDARLQLVDDERGGPLAHRTFIWTHGASDAAETAATDGRGLATVGLVFVTGADAQDAEVTVRVSDESGAEAVAEVSVPPDPTEVIEVRLSFGAAPSERLRLIDLIGEDAAESLSDAGVETVSDLLDRGSDLPDGADRAVAAAKLALIGPDLPQAAREAMLEDGLTGPAAVAALPRDTFLRRYARLMDDPSDALAYYVAALNTSAAVGHQIGGARIKLETTPGDEDPPDIPEDVTGTLATLSGCGCEECLSAVSPAAYLAQLIDWVLTHLRSNGQEVTLSQLVSDLHQPFDELPASCDAVEHEVRQVRLVIEVLWRFLDMVPTEDLDMPTGFRRAYREVRNRLYHAILANLGADHDRLRIAVSQGDAEDSDLVARTRERLAAILGITEDRLDALWFDTDQAPVSPSEATLQQLFGYRDTRGDPFAALQRPNLISWQREGLEEIWQDQDWVADGYAGENRLAFIDPALIGAPDLRSPVAGEAAFDLLIARQDSLQDHRSSLESLAPPGTGFAGYDGLLQSELGQSHADLSDLAAALAQPPQEDPDPTPAEEFASLDLDAAALAHLVKFGARLAENSSLGDAAVADAWSVVYDILGRAHRIGLRSAWVTEEDQQGIVLGARVFAPAVVPAPLPSPWVATASEREAWLAALAARNAPPVIDPDLFPQYFIMTVFVAKPFGSGSDEDPPEGLGGIPFGDSLTLVQPPLEPFDLWEERREFIDGRLSAITDARQGAATRFDAILAMMAASNSGLDLDTLDAMAQTEDDGRPVGAELARLSLDGLAYRTLERIVGEARAGVNVTVDDLDIVAAILVQTEKRLLFSEWRRREADLGITLHPATFKVLSDPADYASQVASPWLHDTDALSAWLRRLEGRQSQFDAIRAALTEAVRAAEDVILPLLRNILIRHSAGDGSVFREAERLSRRLLADMAMDGCQMTTRVAFAFQTLQALIRGTYNQEHRAPLDILSLDTDADYEADWPIIGSYPAWRGHMLVYIFPESILHVVPHPRQTPEFAQLMSRLPTRLGPQQACEVARAYGDYLADISGLRVDATCQAQTRVADSNPCLGSGSTVRSLVHVFGHARGTGRVYWAHYEGFPENKDTLSAWRPVPKLGDVTEIVGAVEHLTPEDRRLVLLFVKTRPLDRTRLQMVQLDLDALNWSKVFDLDLPPESQPDLTVRTVQKRHGGADLAFGIASAAHGEEVPTVMAFRTPASLFYVRALNRQATDWSGPGWMPLLGLGRSRQFAELCALVQRNKRQYVMIVRHANGYLYYREFWVDSAVGRDDGLWRSIARGSFGGALTWPDTEDIFVFYHRSNGTHYAHIDVARSLEADGFPTVSLVSLNSWLISVVGVDLGKFTLEFVEPYDRQRVTGYPTDPNDLSDALANPAFLDERVLLGYEGDLLGLLTETASDDEFLGYLNSPRDELEAKQERGLSIFREFMATANLEPFGNGQTRDWRVADLIVRQMFGGRGLVTVVERIFAGEETRPLYRGLQTEAETIEKASADTWRIVPSGGDEESPPTPRKAVVLKTSDGTFRMKLRRAGDILSTPKLHRIVLAAAGPTDLAPLRRRDALVLRKGDIKAAYEVNAGAPASVTIYLKEAYNHLPIRLAQALQQNGSFDEALLWYRQVFDYLQKAGSRKIDHGLVVEQSLPLDYDKAEAFFDEPENAHAIAESRQNSYTRQVLLLIIQCLLDQADTSYSTDTSNGLSRARELYLLALRLLDFNVLRPGSSPCDAIIGTLDVDLPGGALDLTQFRAILVEMTDPDELDAVVADLRAAASDTASPVRDRIERLRSIASAAAFSIAAPQTVAQLREVSVDRRLALETAMFADPVQRRHAAGTALRRAEAVRDGLAAVTAVPRALPASGSLSAILAPDEPREPLPEFRVARFGNDGPQMLASLVTTTANAPLAAISFASLSGGSGGGGGFGVGGVSFSFCIPQNPLLLALARRAETNLQKLRSCRNLAGLVRTTLPYDGPIGIGAGAIAADGSILPSTLVAPSSAYSYARLVERAKELVALSQQMEASYRAALESAEAAALTEMNARHAVDSAQAQVGLRTLGLEASRAELNLATQQQTAARFQVGAYARRIAEGMSSYESEMLTAYSQSAIAQQAANAAATGATIAAITASLAKVDGVLDAFAKGFQGAAAATQIGFVTAQGIASGFAIDAGARAQAAAVNLSFEQRTKDLQFQQSIAAEDLLVAQQQIAVAEAGVAIAREEIRIAQLAQTQAADVLAYLERRIFTEGTYRWIASVLGSVYRFFLQEAEAVARLAEDQLAFETASAPKRIIGTGYWSLPRYNAASTAAQDLGLTGSARLLEDVYRLDQAAFLGRQRKQYQSITLDLAKLFPLDFQRFRETGEMVFETTSGMLDQSMAGSFLCMIEHVQVSFVGLVSPVNSIRGALLKSGLSRVVVGGTAFAEVMLRGAPERLALTAASTDTSVAPPTGEPSDGVRKPFQGSGFATQWGLNVPKDANGFDYRGLATVLVTFVYSALHSESYADQIRSKRDKRVSFEKAYSLRRNFPDAWYDLNNPDLTPSPMQVQFTTIRDDFPPNLSGFALEAVVLYIVRRDGEDFELDLDALTFRPEGASGEVGGAAVTVDARVSTRSGNGTPWLPMLGSVPNGGWTLALPDTPSMRALFDDLLIEDILLVLTIEARQ